MDENKKLTCARFYCNYFFGDSNTIVESNGLGNESYNWYRCWRYSPDAKFISHEPPTYTLRAGKIFKRNINLSKYNVLERDITRANGIMLFHYAFIHRNQVRFKEDYYKMNGLVVAWEELRKKIEMKKYTTIEEQFPMLNSNLFKGKLLPFQYKHPLKNVIL